MKKIGLISCCVMIFMQSYSQLQIGSEIRPRTELWHGYKGLLPDTANIPGLTISQRTRLYVTFEKNNVRSYISFQDVRIWGDEDLYSSTGIKGKKASIDLYEAYLKLSFPEHHNLKIGRQEIKIDDQRLLSNRNWNQYGHTYDAVLYSFSNNNLELTTSFSWNNTTYSKWGFEYDTGRMKSMNFLYMKKKFSKESFVSFLGLLTAYYHNTQRELKWIHTFGPSLLLKGQKSSFLINVFYQGGINKNDERIAAWFLHSQVSKKINKFKIIAAIDHFSGDNSQTDNLDRSFDNLYGGRHRFLGDMDMFGDLHKSTLDAGLTDLYVKFEYEFSDKFNSNLSYHFFQTEQNVSLPDNTLIFNKKLGDEIDLSFSGRFNDILLIKTGVAYFLPTNTIKTICNPGVCLQHEAYFFWFELTYKGLYL